MARRSLAEEAVEGPNLAMEEVVARCQTVMEGVEERRNQALVVLVVGLTC